MTVIKADLLPQLPPPRWFPRLELTDESYREKVEWLTLRLYSIVAGLTEARGTAAYESGFHALDEVSRDELAAWMTCCWMASATAVNLGPLPDGQHWAITTNTAPAELANSVPHLIHAQMRTEAARFLTAAARGVVPPPLRDWGYTAILLLLATLTDAFGRSEHPDTSQPVTAQPGAEVPPFVRNPS